MPILIPTGFTGDSKTPRVVSEVRYGQGAGNIGAFARSILLAGYYSGAGLSNNELFEIIDPEEAMEAAGYGSELACMIEVASKTPGVLGKMHGLAVQVPAGGTAATATITFSGTATEGGSCYIYLDNKVVGVSFKSGETATTAGDKAEAEIAAIKNGFCTPSNAAGTVTLTELAAVARGNDHVLWIDKTRMPKGLSVAIAGGTAFSNGAVPFTGGAGDDASNLSTILSATANVKFDYSGWALNEATSIDDICNQAATKAGPDGVGPENCCFGFNGTVSAAGTRSQLGNQVLGQMAWMEGRVHPSLLAAAMAAGRMVTEAQPVTSFWGNPNHRYDFQELYGIPAHFKSTQSPGTSVTDVALNTGVTPIVTRNGKAVICRAITMRSLDGSNPDYRTLDVSESMVPQRVREDLDNLWTNEHALANTTVSDDPPSDEEAPEGRSTPKKWGGDINGRLKIAERENLIIETDTNPAVVVYNTSLKCLIANVPTKVAPQNHQTGIVVRQIPA